MKNLIANRVYVDLFAGAGYAKIRDTNRVLFSSALISLSLPVPFTKYIFSEKDENLLNALKERVKRHFPDKEHLVTYVPGDTNKNVERIKELIPPYYPERKVLTFCFVDPFSLRLRFSTIRCLAERRIDFLILLALPMDGKRNMKKYLIEENERVKYFIDSNDWREEFRNTGYSPSDFTKFLSEKYDINMKDIGYITPPDKHRISTFEGGVPLYYLAFYSKHERGNEFWEKIRNYSDGQLGIF